MSFSKFFLMVSCAVALGRAAVLVDPSSGSSLVPVYYSFSSGPNAISLLLNNVGRPQCPSKLVVQGNQKRSPSPSETKPSNLSPTPAPTGKSTPSTTVHISSESDFALLLPGTPGKLISDAEIDGVSFCTSGSSDSSCSRRMESGFITAAAIAQADDGSWIQVTGCIDTTKSSLSASDDGGQFDVRFPNGAQCTFGGYGASFIEQVEPSSNRFCLRCCQSANDQENCNSHQDTAGCVTAVPGTYDFPDLGISCS